MTMITENKSVLLQMRELMRRMGYAYKTENTYCDWVRRFIKFSNVGGKNELLEDAQTKVEGFLNDLAVKQNKSLSGPNYLSVPFNH